MVVLMVKRFIVYLIWFLLYVDILGLLLLFIVIVVGKMGIDGIRVLWCKISNFDY